MRSESPALAIAVQAEPHNQLTGPGATLTGLGK
jgi:hypothetical protein